MSSAPEKRPAMMVAVVGLVIAATVVLCIFRLPLPIRLAVAGTDLIAALVLFAYARQNT